MTPRRSRASTDSGGGNAWTRSEKRRQDRQAKNAIDVRECAQAGAARSTSSGTPVAQECCRACRAAPMKHRSRTSSPAPDTRTGLLPELTVGARTDRTMPDRGHRRCRLALGRRRLVDRIVLLHPGGAAAHAFSPVRPYRLVLVDELARELRISELRRGQSRHRRLDPDHRPRNRPGRHHGERYRTRVDRDTDARVDERARTREARFQSPATENWST